MRSHTEDDHIDAVIWEQAGDFLKLREGVCPDCAGRVDAEVLDADSVPVAAPVPLSFGTLNECRQCKRLFGIPLPYAAAYHPESVAFHWKQGIDILGTGALEFHNYIHDGQWSSHRVASNPDEFRVEFECETTALNLFLDETATVTRTERVQRRNQDERRR